MLIHLDGSFRPVTPDGVISAWPTPDGKYVLGETVGTRQMALYPLACGAAVPVKGLTPADDPPGFGAHDDDFYVRQIHGPNSPVFEVNLRTGQRQLIAALHPAGPAGFSQYGNASISRDGKVIAFGYVTSLSTLYVASGLH